MKTSALLAAIVIAVAIAACGGDDDGGPTPTLNGSPTPTRAVPLGTTRAATSGESTYFAALVTVLDKAYADQQALAAEKTQAFDAAKSVADRQAAGAKLASDIAAAYKSRRDGILNVQPQPPTGLHSEALALGSAADDAVTVTSGVADVLANQPVETEAQYDAVLADQGVAAVLQRYRQACVALENEATLVTLTVDLHCDG